MRRTIEITLIVIISAVVAAFLIYPTTRPAATTPRPAVTITQSARPAPAVTVTKTRTKTVNAYPQCGESVQTDGRNGTDEDLSAAAAAGGCIWHP